MILYYSPTLPNHWIVSLDGREYLVPANGKWSQRREWNHSVPVYPAVGVSPAVIRMDA